MQKRVSTLIVVLLTRVSWCRYHFCRFVLLLFKLGVGKDFEGPFDPPDEDEADEEEEVDKLLVRHPSDL